MNTIYKSIKTGKFYGEVIENGRAKVSVREVFPSLEHYKKTGQNVIFEIYQLIRK